MSSPTHAAIQRTGDSSVSSKVTASNSYTTGEIVYLSIAVGHNGGSHTVTSVTGTGLTFTQRKAVGYTSGGVTVNVTQWYAPVTSNTTTTLTITFDGTIDCCHYYLGVIDSAYSTAAYLDIDPTLPESSTTGTDTFSTTQADDFVLAHVFSLASTGYTTPAGWTSDSGGPFGFGGAHGVTLRLQDFYKSLSATVTNDTTLAMGMGFVGISVLDAFTSDPPPASGRQTTVIAWVDII